MGSGGGGGEGSGDGVAIVLQLRKGGGGLAVGLGAAALQVGKAVGEGGGHGSGGEGAGEADKAPEFFDVRSTTRAVAADARGKRRDVAAEVGLRLSGGEPVGVRGFEGGHGLVSLGLTLLL